MDQENKQNLVQDWIDKQPEAQSEGSAAVDLSVVIPAFNEQWRLPTTLIDVIDYCDLYAGVYEIVVVDDGSTDGTVQAVRKFEKIRPQVRLISYPRNHGKGYAVRTGVLNAKGAKILFADADGSTPIAELARLDNALRAGADVVIGSRAMVTRETRVITRWYRKYLGRIFNFFVNVLVLPGIADTQCGFKIFTRNAAEFLFRLQSCDGYSFDVEVLFIARRAGLKIQEVPVNWENAPGSKVNLVLDSLKMFRDILFFRWKHRTITPHSFRSAQ